MQCRRCKQSIPDNSLYCLYCGCRQSTEPQGRKKRGNGHGTAYKRGSTWTAKWTKYVLMDDDKLHQIQHTKGGFASKSEALRYAANPPGDTRGASTLRMYWNTWSSNAMQDIGETKQDAYRIAWKKMESIADVDITTLAISDLQRVVDDKAKTHYPARDMRTLYSHLYKMAVAEGVVPRNLAEFVRVPKLEEKPMEAFTELEIRKLWQSYGKGNDFLGYVLLMVYTGMMPGELLGLEVDMIQWSAREIIGAGRKTKKRKETPIVLPEFILPVLAALTEHASTKTGRLVAMSEDNFRLRYKEALDMAGVRVLPPYSCRHTTATALAMGNVAPSVIQEIMRHTKFSTTQRYIHPDMQSALKAVDNMPH